MKQFKLRQQKSFIKVLKRTTFRKEEDELESSRLSCNIYNTSKFVFEKAIQCKYDNLCKWPNRLT